MQHDEDIDNIDIFEDIIAIQPYFLRTNSLCILSNFVWMTENRFQQPQHTTIPVDFATFEACTDLKIRESFFRSLCGSIVRESSLKMKHIEPFYRKMKAAVQNYIEKDSITPLYDMQVLSSILCEFYVKAIVYGLKFARQHLPLPYDDKKALPWYSHGLVQLEYIIKLGEVIIDWEKNIMHIISFYDASEHHADNTRLKGSIKFKESELSFYKILVHHCLAAAQQAHVIEVKLLTEIDIDVKHLLENGDSSQLQEDIIRQLENVRDGNKIFIQNLESIMKEKERENDIKTKSAIETLTQYKWPMKLRTYLSEYRDREEALAEIRRRICSYPLGK